MIDGPRHPSETKLAHDTRTAPPARARAPSSFGALAGARTPLDASEASRCLARAWQSVLGEPAPAPALELLWAQWALETAHGRAMRGNNFGGIKTRRGGALYATIEGAGAERVRVLGRFRTYATPDEGARDHVALVAHRYPEALEALRRGDAAEFVAELARGGYFTADPAAYRRGIERLAAEHAGLAAGLAASTEGSVAVGELVEGVLASLRPRRER